MSNYKISRRIGRGGMAEIFLAMQEGIGGFEKIVTVKRIFPHFCEDEKFVQMFLDEARLAAAIRHPNVVEILDIRQDKDGFFIVMEYLSGETLAYMFESINERDEAMPVAMVCRIGADIAAGLHAGHSTTEVDGELQPIIHRDVTPSNVIVCFNGFIKIVDFGVAKATLGKSHSRPGSLKGKIPYLAPEQILDKPADARTDVFQLGVVLHEMVTGQRLFSAGTDHKAMNAVLQRRIPPPSEICPDLPEELDRVLLGALERDHSKRTQTADQLRRGLEKVLSAIGQSVTQQDVAEWMQGAFSEQRDKRLKIERECIAEMREGRPSGEMPAMVAPFAPTAPVTLDHDDSDGMAGAATVADRPSPRVSIPTREPQRRRRRPLLAGIAVAAAIAVAVIAWLRSSGDDGGESRPQTVSSMPTVAAPAAPGADHASTSALPDAASPTFEARIRTVPADARVVFDGELVGFGGFTAILPLDGTTHRIQVSAPGYEPQITVIRDAPPPLVITLSPRRQTASADKARSKVDSASLSADKAPPAAVRSDGIDASPSPNPAPDNGDEIGPQTDNRDPWR